MVSWSEIKSCSCINKGSCNWKRQEEIRLIPSGFNSGYTKKCGYTYKRNRKNNGFKDQQCTADAEKRKKLYSPTATGAPVTSQEKVTFKSSNSSICKSKRQNIRKEKGQEGQGLQSVLGSKAVYVW